MPNVAGWFPQTNQDTLQMLIEKHNVKTVIEIGTFVGLSAIWFAERVEQVVTIDPFDAITRIDYLHGEMRELAVEQFKNFQKFTAPFSNIKFIQATSMEAYFDNPLLQADLIYIDGSHKYADVVLDIALWQNRASKVVCGDDYTDAWPEVCAAVNLHSRIININKDQRCWYHEVK